MSLPRVETRNGRKLLLVDEKPFILLCGELHNSSSSTTEYMGPVWDQMQALHLNSLLFPVTWQQVEPEEGEFHFELVDGLIEQARAHGMKFGILWFGTWKTPPAPMRRRGLRRTWSVSRVRKWKRENVSKTSRLKPL